MRYIFNLDQHPENRKKRFPSHLWPPNLDEKSEDEWWILLYFLRAADFLLNKTPEKLDPPKPDFECLVSGQQRLFELGEVLDSSLAEGLAFSAKEARRKNGSIETGGCKSFSANGSLLRMLGKKLAKKYDTAGAPCDLLLFYDQQSPYGPFECLLDYTEQLVPLMDGSSFENIWLFHLPSEQVMGTFRIVHTGDLQIVYDQRFAFDMNARFQTIVPGIGDEPDRMELFEPVLSRLRLPKQ